MNQIEDRLSKYGDLELNSSLAKKTTFKIGGNADYFMYPKNEIALLRILEICKENHLPYKIFGKGSNILCSDADFHGVVICLDRYFNEFQFEEDGICYAQAGVSLILLAHAAMKNSLSGLEFASGIPATLGGALFMNAGAYKSNMADIVQKVYILKDDACVWMDMKDLDYSYRHSIFQNNRDWIIIGARLKLQKGNQSEIKEIVDSRRKRRMQSQPLDKPSAGSVFRNPKEHAAWKLIEDIGLRGKVHGGAQISEKHANFIVNANNATANDVYQLILTIQKEVHDQYGIQLKMEVERFNWQE